jgi:hypothetical protein
MLIDFSLIDIGSLLGGPLHGSHQACRSHAPFTTRALFPAGLAARAKPVRPKRKRAARGAALFWGGGESLYRHSTLVIS